MFVAGFLRKLADGSTANAINAATQAVKQTETGKAVSKTINDTSNKYLDQARNINLLGGSGAPTGAAASGSGTNAPKASASLAIKDANRIELNAGQFSASVGKNGVKSNLDLGGGLGLEAGVKGGDKSVGLSFKRSF